MTKMIRKNSKEILFILLSLAAFMIWGSGIYYGQYIKENYQSVSVRIHEETVTKQALMRAIETEGEKGTKQIPSITAWNRLEKMTIENNELGTKSLTRVFEVYGDMKQVYPMELTKGSLPNKEDYEGCVIDVTVAYELFRTSEAVGNFLTYQNKQYCIRGVFKSEEPMFLIQVYSKDKAYSNLELVYTDKENGEKLANEFTVQNTLSDSYTIIEGCFYAHILEILYQMPAWFLGLYMVFKLLQVIWRRRTIPLQVLILSIVLVITWICLNWLMEFHIYIPERLIPTKWSNFTFWTEKYTIFRNQMEQIVYLTPLPKDVIFIRYTKRCVFEVLLTLVSMIIFVTHKKVFLIKNSGIKGVILSILIEGGAILLLCNSGKVFHVTKGYLYMLPLFIMSIDLIKRGKEVMLDISQKNN